MTYQPSKWVSTSLENLGEWGSGGTPQRTNPLYYQNGTIPWLIIGDLNDGIVTKAATYITQAGLENSSAKLLPINTLLVAMYGSIGKLGITGIECATNQAIAYCKPYPELASLKYLFYALMNSKDELVAKGRGGAQQNINQGVLKAHKVHLAPFNEQKRIADKLDSLLTRVNACYTHLDRVSQILKRFRQSVLNAAITGLLTDDWRDKRTNLSEYRSVTLREVAISFNYGTSAKSKKSGRIPVLRMGNIQDGKLDWTDLAFTSGKDEVKKYKLVKGDVLFNRTNSPELVGKTAVYKGERPAIYAGYLIRVKCGDKLLPDFLNYCLNSPMGRRWAWQVKSDGVSQSNINAQKLADFEFELPSIEEQAEIVRRVEKLFTYAESLEARYQSTTEQVERLTPSLLTKAFRGELVEQDQNDEPASKLLERFKIARENMPKEIKKPRRKNDIASEKTEIDENRLSIIQALKTSGKELSAQQLFQLAGYPMDAESGLVEEFFVEVRDALDSKLIQKRRRNETDWFSLINK